MRKQIVMINVDMGYLTFKMAFGSYEGWELTNGQYVNFAGWDSSEPYRKKVNSSYKLNRNEGQEELRQTVHELRNNVLKTSSLPICNIQGMEADDLVACWYLFNPTDKVLSVDKDYFQLPGLKQTYDYNATPFTKEKVISKLPKYLQELATKNFALYQMLYGDSTDGIPRLLSKGKEGKEQVLYILKHLDNMNFGSLLISMFGESIIENAKLVLFPFYQKGNWVYPEEEFFDVWADGEYYNKEYWIDFYETIKEETREKGLFQLSLFD